MMQKGSYFVAEGSMKCLSKKASKKGRRKDTPKQHVTPERIEHFYNVVATHLRVLGTWNLTVRKFPPGAIRGVIKQILDRLASNAQTRPVTFDWGVEFELLRDYETVDDFLEHLEAEYKVPNNWEAEAYEYALSKLEEDATALGKQVISNAEYYWLKGCERRLKKLQRLYNIG